MVTTEVPVSFEDTSIAFSSKSDKQLTKMNFLFSAMNSNLLVKTGTSLLNTSIILGLPVKGLIKATVFEHFCGGETIGECEKTINQLGKFNIGTILDYSVEGEKTEAGFESTTTEILRTIDKAKGNKNLPFCVFKVTGLGSIEILTKVQNKETLTKFESEAFERVRDRVNKICKHAFESDVKIFIDAEETWMQNTIDDLAYEMMKLYNKKSCIVYNTFQMYRADMLANLKLAMHNAVANEYFLGVKLVRGAYMEKERARAKSMGYKDPIQPDKASSDADFNKALLFCVDNIQRINLCCGSHNEYSNYYLTAIMNKYGIKPSDQRIYFAQLYGMSDNISYNLANAGFNVAKYVPYGPVKAVMPYLIRRANENTAIAGQTSRELLLIKKEMSRRKSLKKN